MPTPSTYWHTIRHLKTTQIVSRLRRSFPSGRLPNRPAPEPRATNRDRWLTHHQLPSGMLGPDRFRFLNETRDLPTNGWDDPTVPKLWRYNLHYFDCLNATDATAQERWHVDLLQRWVAENPPTAGTGWEPYPTSLRIVNWIKWFLDGRTHTDVCVTSLATQTRWLSKRLETHLLGNHLFANAKALVFAGCFFDGREADAWLKRGFGILIKQIPEQILRDGGHFERSPMYHALALLDCLDLCNLAQTYEGQLQPQYGGVVDAIRDKIEPMVTWLITMTHPDGDISLFNDCAFKIAPPPSTLYDYADKLGFPHVALPDAAVTRLDPSGYIRLQHRPLVAILDVGPIGPDYLPGHGHADVLSFELSVFGHRVFVDTGTSHYALDAERLRQRGTAAHNTVLINDTNSSEVWSAFRVARRATPVGLDVRSDDGMIVRCSHDGYSRLPGSPIHTREWRLQGNTLAIHDHISGPFQTAEARFHLHPAVTVMEPASDTAVPCVNLGLSDGTVLCFAVTDGQLGYERSTWHPEFGVTDEITCLVIQFDTHDVHVSLTWEMNT